MGCQCVICTVDFDQAATIVGTPCGHAFHQVCLNHWIGRNPTCPTCRRRVEPRDVRRVYLTFLDDNIAVDPREIERNLARAKQKVEKLRQKILEQQNMLDFMRAFIGECEPGLASLKEDLNDAVQKVQALELAVRMARGVSGANAFAQLLEIIGNGFRNMLSKIFA